MASGRANQLAKQAGEYLVAAELSRRGYISTTFTGNVPDYDIVAVDETGGHALIQVKTTRSTSWPFDIQKFVEIRLDGSRQSILGLAPARYPELICVMVQLATAESSGRDRFFILPWTVLQEIARQGYEAYLFKHGGIRPKKPDSFRSSIYPVAVEEWENRWDVIGKRVRPIGSDDITIQPTTGARRKLRR